MHYKNVLFFITVLLIIVSCDNLKMLNKTDVPLGQLLSIDSFDDAIVTYGILGDTVEFTTKADFSPIKATFLNARRSNKEMVWKGSFYITFKNNITIEVSYYGSFFRVYSTGDLFIVTENYSQGFETFIHKMMVADRKKRKMTSAIDKINN
jgi:hypothetical protein